MPGFGNLIIIFDHSKVAAPSLHSSPLVFGLHFVGLMLACASPSRHASAESSVFETLSVLSLQLAFAELFPSFSHLRLESHSSVTYACALQRKFDTKYGPTWHCIVGSDFKAAFTHESKNFIFLTVGKSNVLLYKSG